MNLILNALIQHLDQTQLDLILVEGFKHISFQKIELYRSDLYGSDKGHQPLFLSDISIIAVASDIHLKKTENIDVLDLNSTNAILEYIVTKFDL